MKKDKLTQAINRLPSLSDLTTTKPNNRLTNKQQSKQLEMNTKQSTEVNTKMNQNQESSKDTTNFNPATTYKKSNKPSKYEQQEVDVKGLKALTDIEISELSHADAIVYLKTLVTLNPKSLWELYSDIVKFEDKVVISLSKTTGQCDALINPRKVLQEVVNFLKVPKRKPALLTILLRALQDDLTEIID
jgi:flagellar hook protein FlgE